MGCIVVIAAIQANYYFFFEEKLAQGFSGQHMR